MFEEIPKLDKKGLRKFGLITGAMIAGVFGLLLPFFWGRSLPLLPWIIGSVFSSLAIFVPQSLDPIHYGWMKGSQVFAGINNQITLGIIFFIFITPMSLIMRLFNRDTMTRKFDFQAETYRTSSTIKTPKSMEKPY